MVRWCLSNYKHPFVLKIAFPLQIQLHLLQADVRFFFVFVYCPCADIEFDMDFCCIFICFERASGACSGVGTLICPILPT